MVYLRELESHKEGAMKIVREQFKEIEGGIEINFHGNILHASEPCYRIPNYIVHQAFNDLQDVFDIRYLDGEVITLDRKLRLNIDGEWTESSYHGRGYACGVVLGGCSEVPSISTVGRMIIHEIGHMVMYDAFQTNYAEHLPHLKEYAKLRGIELRNGNDWYGRTAEDFAEAFTLLFGNSYVHSEPFKIFDKTSEPTREVRDYFLSLQLRDIGEIMEERKQVTSPWAQEAQKVLSELGVTDGSRPKDNVTREELWTMLYRINQPKK